MRCFALLLIILPLSCTSVRTGTVSDSRSADIKNFLQLCEKDLRSATKVVVGNDLIKNLSHLQFMNAGGNKYYILERENITKMIQAVTEGIYSDFILINGKGTIIYTKYNDTIFSKNVRTSLAETPLSENYSKKLAIHFSGIGPLKREKDTVGPSLFFPSIFIKGDERTSGIFALQVDKQKLMELIGSRSRIVDDKGKILVSYREVEEGTVFPHFASIEALEKKGSSDTKGKGWSYVPFSHANIQWYIVRDTE